MQIHQILPGFHFGDAISNEAIALKRHLRSWGYESEIYAETMQDEVAHECQPWDRYLPAKDCATIYHYSIGSKNLTRLFLESPGKKLLIYHNITPHECFARYNPFAYEACKTGREDLPRLHEAVDVALGDSLFNCQELARHGFPDPRVLPIVVDFHALDSAEPSQKILRRYDDDWTNFLFVGRVSPNKRQDDVVRAFAHYQRWIDRRSRLFLVGSWGGMENYLAEIQSLASLYGLEDHVVFAGHVSLAKLVAYYKLADVFLCLSDHEGFCVPLVEALHFDVPVLGYATAAVPDTLGEAGLLVSEKNFPIIAETAHLLSNDQDLRDLVLKRQAQRLADFRPQVVENLFRSYVDELVGC
jgi:glycosyltransferase involved in cell wall biosynthesis